ncbi:hypothetical protein SanaruYs_00440 [Chryseotalea sanaruensis]|uniref:Uncharacterized protein n=1 Tax=Chryseotalea sanaruensis TaxID=2482724 RepID=A0A401U4R0_9BACT|nr:hypothetical protein [Chryseotalea sanaruensis]GCC49830.1 hypothetical protein SanaruYs_00440 [Chryseotalea sanaruensis]
MKRKRIVESEVISKVINNFVIPVIVVSYASYLVSRINNLLIYDYIIAVLVIILSVLIIAYQKALDRWYERLILNSRNINSGVVLDFIKITVEYLDDKGKRVSIRRHDFVSNFISTEADIRPVELKSDGKISNVSTIHCNYRFSNNSFLKFFYDKRQRKNGNDLHVYCSCIIEDGFINDTKEYWIIKGINYCKFYRLEIVIPDREVKGVDMFWREKDDELEAHENDRSEVLERENKRPWQRVVDSRILLTQACGRSIIYTYVPSLLPTEEFKLEWELGKSIA